MLRGQICILWPFFKIMTLKTGMFIICRHIFTGPDRNSRNSSSGAITKDAVTLHSTSRVRLPPITPLVLSKADYDKVVQEKKRKLESEIEANELVTAFFKEKLERLKGMYWI